MLKEQSMSVVSFPPNSALRNWHAHNQSVGPQAEEETS